MRGVMKYDRLKLREVLTEQGRRNDWLAAQTGYTPQTIARYLGGQYPITDNFAELASKALGIPVSFLLADEPEPAEQVAS